MERLESQLAGADVLDKAVLDGVDGIVRPGTTITPPPTTPGSTQPSSRPRRRQGAS